MTIPISRTILTAEEIESVLKPLKSGWLVQGQHVQEFEEKWSAFTGVEHSIAVTSCTTAMHLTLAALGIGPGSEVIVPALTWISTANVVEHLGARPILCDINVSTFNIDVEDAASKVTDRTRAIMPVHLFGLSADMDPVMELARRHDLAVIEDAACGFGARYKGKHVGNFGVSGNFSFHPRKAITTGEGGMVTTSDGQFAARLRRLRDHGANMTDFVRHQGSKPHVLPDFPDAGFNFRMTDIQGALGSAQMNRADQILAERRRLAKRYDEAFCNLSWLKTPKVHSDFDHGYQSYACIFMQEEVDSALASRDRDLILKVSKVRDDWMNELHHAGISTRPATHAVHMLDYYKTKYDYSDVDFFGAFAAYKSSVSLPLYPGMTVEEQDHVIETIHGKAL